MKRSLSESSRFWKRLTPPPSEWDRARFQRLRVRPSGSKEAQARHRGQWSMAGHGREGLRTNLYLQLEFDWNYFSYWHHFQLFLITTMLKDRCCLLNESTAEKSYLRGTGARGPGPSWWFTDRYWWQVMDIDETYEGPLRRNRQNYWRSHLGAGLRSPGCSLFVRTLPKGLQHPFG